MCDLFCKEKSLLLCMPLFNVVPMCTCRDITMATSSTELLQTEGTVMLHILFAIKQDQDIGKELLEAVKVCARQSVCFRVCRHSMHVPLYVILSLYGCHCICQRDTIFISHSM